MTLRSRLDPNTLADCPEAYFWYAAALDPEDARVWLQRASEHFDDAQWLDICVGIAWIAGSTSHRGVAEMAVPIADRIVKHKTVEGLEDVLRGLVAAPLLRPVYPRVGEWLARHATAGEMGLVADWLTAGAVSDDPSVRLQLELALLERGSAELRRPERISLAAQIVESVDKGQPDRREMALRVLLHNERARQMAEASPDKMGRDGMPGVNPPALLAITERTLADGADLSLAWDVATVVGWIGACRIAFGTPTLGRVSAALIEKLADDAESVGPWGARSCFDDLLRSEHDLPTLRSPHAIRDAIAAVVHARPSEPERRRVERWARTAAESWFDVHGLCQGDVAGMTLLERVAQDRVESMLKNPLLHRPVREALEHRLSNAAGTRVEAARAILDAHPDEPSAVVPAFRALPVRAILLDAVTGGGVSLADLTVELERLLLRPWPRRVGGVDLDNLLGGAGCIRCTPLANERKYDLSGGALQLDDRSLLHTVADAKGETALALAALYVAHELVHGAQGLDDKGTVAALRATGGETALLHLDLAADHAAALVVHEARRTWPIEWLNGAAWRECSPVSRRSAPHRGGPRAEDRTRAGAAGGLLGPRASDHFGGRAGGRLCVRRVRARRWPHCHTRERSADEGPRTRRALCGRCEAVGASRRPERPDAVGARSRAAAPRAASVCLAGFGAVVSERSWWMTPSGVLGPEKLVGAPVGGSSSRRSARARMCWRSAGRSSRRGWRSTRGATVRGRRSSRRLCRKPSRSSRSSTSHAFASVRQ